jgi:AcrR family transcriptional regulator
MPANAPEKRLRPRKTPRQERSVETRARILDAARAVFAEHGYAAGTTNRIATAAGISIGSLYQYFPNKDAILLELVRAHIDDGTRRVIDVLAPALAGPAAIEDVVRAIVTTLVDVHARDRRLHRVLFEESPRPPALLRQLRDLEDAAVSSVTVVIERDLPHVDDPSFAARLVVATIESLVHRMIATERRVDQRQFVDELTRLVVGYLQPRSEVTP